MNSYSQLYVKAAKELGLPYQIIDAQHNLISIGKVKLISCSASINDTVASAIAKRKDFASHLISQVLPNLIPCSLVLSEHTNQSIQQLHQFYEDCTQEIVLKPHNLSKGTGVYVLPQKDDLGKILKSVLDIQSGIKVIAEKYYAGNEYRIVAVDKEIIGIFQRIPANVMGDGKSTILNLIEKKNNLKLSAGLPIIKIDDSLGEMLSRQRLTLDTVPGEGKFIQLKAVCNLSTGGDVEELDIKEVNRSVNEVVNAVNQATSLRLFGIDLICPDIKTTDLIKSSNSIINEINHAPCLKVMYAASGIEPIKRLVSEFVKL